MRCRLLLLPLAVVLVTAACGGASTQPTIYAASSLKLVFPEIYGDATYSFAGSDTLALQIEQGAPADLFAAASPRYPDQLAKQGLCNTPIPFATNTLVLLVPKGNPAGITGVNDLLTGPSRRLAIGDVGVPIGTYSREALKKLNATTILTRNTVSDEQDAAGVVAKVALGSADAGIAYATDAKSAPDKVQAIPLPAEAEPVITYLACVVIRAGTDQAGAQALLDRLSGLQGQAALVAAGFGPAPS